MAQNQAVDLTGATVTNNSAPPELQTATVDGQFLVLTYGEALDPTSTPAATDFVVTLGNNQSLSVGAVTLTEWFRTLSAIWRC